MSRKRTLPSQDTCWYVAYRGGGLCTGRMYFSAKAKRTNPRYWRRNVTTASTIAWQSSTKARQQVNFATSSDSNITGFLGRHDLARNRFLQLPTLTRRTRASWSSSFFGSRSKMIQVYITVHAHVCCFTSTALAGRYPRRVKTYALVSFGDWTASRRQGNRFQQT